MRWYLLSLISQFGLTEREKGDRVNAIGEKERNDGVRRGGGASQSSGHRRGGVSRDRGRRVAAPARPHLTPAGEGGDSDRGDGAQWARLARTAGVFGGC